MADNDSTAQGDHVEIGAVLEAMARDGVPLPPTPNAMCSGDSPYDRAVNALVAAANLSDEAEYQEAQELWEQRQKLSAELTEERLGENQ